jgi:hypothetical protein
MSTIHNELLRRKKWAHFPTNHGRFLQRRKLRHGNWGKIPEVFLQPWMLQPHAPVRTDPGPLSARRYSAVAFGIY